MKFLWSSHSPLPEGFYGVMKTPSGRVEAHVDEGALWAGDNEAFSGLFNRDRFTGWLEKMIPYKDKCLFVAVPDVVGDALNTLVRWGEWRDTLRGWPLAFVAQDGQEHLPLPDGYDVLFIGGTTEWKESPAALDLIRRAQADGKRIHIGRVNWKRRYDMFRVLNGSDKFTCDGTRQRFVGTDKTITAWSRLMSQAPLVQI